jgi:N-acetylmuramic acid 6-phosphate etherase
MTHLQLKNQKLIERGLSIVQQVASVDRSVAFEALQSADMEVPVALVMLGVGVTKREAARRLKRARGNLRMAIGN